MAFHTFILRCSVLSWPSLYLPGYLRCSSSNIVLASIPGFISKYTFIPFQSSSNGHLRVLQALFSSYSLGNFPLFKYLRAVFSLIPAFAAAIETLKLLIASRSFNLANVAASGCGALVGLALGAMLAGLSVRGQIGLAKRSILAYLVYAAWQPFVLSVGRRSMASHIPRGPEWLPLYHYAAGGRPADVQNFLGSLVLAAALAFVGRLAELHEERSGLWSTPISAAVTAGAIGLVLELGQFAVVTREPTITDVLCFAVGGAMGAWLAGHLRNPLPQSAGDARIP